MELDQWIAIYGSASQSAASHTRSRWVSFAGGLLASSLVAIFVAYLAQLGIGTVERPFGIGAAALGLLIGLTWWMNQSRLHIECRHWDSLLRSLEEQFAGGSANIDHAADLIHYWAPECVVDPKVASPQTDVYALGATLYALIAGSAPFRGKDPASLVQQIRRLRPKPLGAVRSDVPHRLSAVVTKAMAKNPDDRYADCQQFVQDLRGAIH